MDPRRQRLTLLQHMWSQRIFQKKCMYNRFSVEEEEDEGVTRRKREKVALKKVGRPQKKKGEKEQKPRPLSLCAVCYSDTFPRSFIHTHIRSTTHTHTHTYIYIYIYLRYLYIHTQGLLQTWSSESCQRRTREKKKLRTEWWFTAQSLISIVSFIKTSNGQPISCRYFIVISPSTCLWWPNDRIPMTNHDPLGERRFSDLVHSGVYVQLIPELLYYGMDVAYGNVCTLCEIWLRPSGSYRLRVRTFGI